MNLHAVGLLVAVYATCLVLIVKTLAKGLNFVKESNLEKIVIRQPASWAVGALSSILFVAGAFLLTQDFAYPPIAKWVVLISGIPAMVRIIKNCELRQTIFDLQKKTYSRTYFWDTPRQWRPTSEVEGLSVRSEGPYLFACYILLPAQTEILACSLMRESAATAFGEELAVKLQITLLP